MPFRDAHCHLQDKRLGALRPSLAEIYREANIDRAVVNGTSPADWEAVRSLAESARSMLMPAYGLHPWHVAGKGEDWQDRLQALWEDTASSVGEIGLDRWIQDYDIEEQLKVFKWQLNQAKVLGKAASIHCLQAWGLLRETLADEAPFAKGFLLHSYSGPVEMIPGFIKLGAYFSFSGYFAWARKAKQREAFKQIPLNRLLIETDSPDMLGPEAVIYSHLNDAEGRAICHPLNLVKNYEYASAMLDLPLEKLRGQVADNFDRLFG